MILIEVDEAAAFDMLSILQVKLGIAPNAFEQFKKLHASIKEQIGAELMHQIMHSDEYMDLVNANVSVFNDLSPENITKLSALDVHQDNLVRFQCKRLLQEKFFDNNITEEKVCQAE